MIFLKKKNIIQKNNILIIKKVCIENSTNITKICSFKHRLFKYNFTKWYYERKGYEVKEEDSGEDWR